MNRTIPFCLSVKVHTFIKKHCRDIGLGQMVNNRLNVHKICFSTFKVLAKVKVCHNDDDNDDNDDGNEVNDYVAGDDTRVMTIPRFFFL